MEPVAAVILAGSLLGIVIPLHFTRGRVLRQHLRRERTRAAECGVSAEPQARVATAIREKLHPSLSQNEAGTGAALVTR